MTAHKTGTREEWLAARAGLLMAEKELTRMGDELARQRRELPWVRIDKEYTFQTADGTKSLAELFEGRSQLVVYHFMFGSAYTSGCPTNSSIADSFDGVLPHLKARDVTMICVSRAPLEKLQAYEYRMGWSFPWVSAGQSDFTFDLGVSSTEEATRGWVEPALEEGWLPPSAAQNASASASDVAVHWACLAPRRRPAAGSSRRSRRAGCRRSPPRTPARAVPTSSAISARGSASTCSRARATPSTTPMPAMGAGWSS